MTMRTRHLAAGAVLAALALPALAQAQPNTYRLETTIAPGDRAALTIGTLPRGEFAFRFRAGSDGEKRFTLTQQRTGGNRFVVVRVPGPSAAACRGAAGSVICSGITTPVAPGGRRWTLRMLNQGDRPLSLDLRVTFRRVTSAG
jgi:hypothetical protein